jgi:hypothetical protein
MKDEQETFPRQPRAPIEKGWQADKSSSAYFGSPSQRSGLYSSASLKLLAELKVVK